jgi:DNA-binding response OmpR family regulator
MPKHRILLVDDDDVHLELLKPFLEREGYWVEKTTKGKEALRLGKTQPYDVILLDIGLPDLDGREVLRRLRESGTKTPVIFITALNSEDDETGGYLDGAADYIVKPFKNAKLFLKIRALLGVVENAKQIGCLICDDLKLDRFQRKIWIKDSEIKLSLGEFDMLAKLMDAAPDVVTPAETDQGLIKQHIYRLRLKLKDKENLIETVEKRGYRFSGKVNKQ